MPGENRGSFSHRRIATDSYIRQIFVEWNIFTFTGKLPPTVSLPNLETLLHARVKRFPKSDFVMDEFGLLCYSCLVVKYFYGLRECSPETGSCMSFAVTDRVFNVSIRAKFKQSIKT
jgi:hypothetical protein